MPKPIQDLIAELNTSSDHAAERAIAKLVKIGKPTAASIRQLLNESSGGLRVNAIDALIELKDRASSAALVRSLSDDQWYVRQHAAVACEHLQISAAVSKLKNLVKTEKRKAVVSAAESALARLSRGPK